MKTGIELIAQERQRQIEKEGYTPESDVDYTVNPNKRTESLALAAVAYATPYFYRDWQKDHQGNPQRDLPPLFFPWSRHEWKPCPEDRVKELTKAGALIAAEIDRLQAKQA